MSEETWMEREARVQCCLAQTVVTPETVPGMRPGDYVDLGDRLVSALALLNAIEKEPKGHTGAHRRLAELAAADVRAALYRLRGTDPPEEQP